MDLIDLAVFLPLAAALALAWGVYQTNRRWEDQKRFERERDRERVRSERRSLAASLLAEITVLQEVVTGQQLLDLARQSLNEDGAIFHIAVREREVMKVYAAQLQNLGTLGVEINAHLARHYSILQAFLDENTSLATAAAMGNTHMLRQEAVVQRIEGQIRLLELLEVNFEITEKLLKKELE